jgi:NAD(P)-dependent dehydrogenase (short-subunit alcohol dehydrogenase family)
MGRLEGKTAVITGGTSGIRLASAKRFATEGAFVYIFGRRHAELDAAVRAIGGKAKGIQGDVSRLEDLDRLLATDSAARGTIDVLFANAGLGNLAPLGGRHDRSDGDRAPWRSIRDGGGGSFSWALAAASTLH